MTFVKLPNVCDNITGYLRRPDEDYWADFESFFVMKMLNDENLAEESKKDYNISNSVLKEIIA